MDLSEALKHIKEGKIVYRRSNDGETLYCYRKDPRDGSLHMGFIEVKIDWDDELLRTQIDSEDLEADDFRIWTWEVD